MRGSLTNASKKYDVTGFLYFSYKQAKLVRPDEPKSKIWGVLGGYPLIVTAYDLWGGKRDDDDDTNTFLEVKEWKFRRRRTHFSKSKSEYLDDDDDDDDDDEHISRSQRVNI